MQKMQEDWVSKPRSGLRAGFKWLHRLLVEWGETAYEYKCSEIIRVSSHYASLVNEPWTRIKSRR